MYKFYLLVWLKWVFRLTFCSVILATFFSSLISLYIYIFQGMVTLDEKVFFALFDVFRFWFPITWSITLLISLFRSLKYIFNSCSNGFELKLKSCNNEFIDFIGYGDLVKVWRKYFMLLIWIIAVEMILALVITNTISSYNSIFEWFDIYILYIFVLVASYFSFIILSSKCKHIKVVKC